MRKSYCKREESDCSKCGHPEEGSGIDCCLNSFDDFDGDGVNPNYYLVTVDEESDWGFGFGFSDEKTAKDFAEKAEKVLWDLYKTYSDCEAFAGSSGAMKTVKQISGVHY